MKKILLFSPIILLFVLVLFIMTLAKSDEEVIKYNNEKNAKVMNKIKEIIPKTQKIVLAIKKNENNESKKYTYSYQNLKYEIVVSITNKEEIEEVKSYLLNVSLPSDDTVFLDYESAKLIQLYDEHDNKILETTGQYLQMSKDEMVRVVDGHMESSLGKKQLRVNLSTLLLTNRT